MKKICVLGAGTMGSGIAQGFAVKGYEVILRDIKDEFVERGLNVI
ncbi:MULTISPECIES: 3-hydroxyacyl-CoA dehydrogenase NAD-binding domain-containing protein, partial [Clostridium]